MEFCVGTSTIELRVSYTLSIFSQGHVSMELWYEPFLFSIVRLPVYKKQTQSRHSWVCWINNSISLHIDFFVSSCRGPRNALDGEERWRLTAKKRFACHVVGNYWRKWQWTIGWKNMIASQLHLVKCKTQKERRSWKQWRVLPESWLSTIRTASLSLPLFSCLLSFLTQHI